MEKPRVVGPESALQTSVNLSEVNYFTFIDVFLQGGNPHIQKISSTSKVPK